MEKTKSPLFTGEPVIVIHLGTDESDEGRWLAACSGERFERGNNDAYQSVPHVLCMGCFNAGKRPLNKLNEITRRLWFISQADRMIISLAGEIQDAVNELRTANGFRKLP